MQFCIITTQRTRPTLDIIAKKGNKLCFIEVKTRVGAAKGKPYEAVGYYKKKSLMRAIQYFLMKNDYKEYKYSLDEISIEFMLNQKVKNITYYTNVLS